MPTPLKNLPSSNGLKSALNSRLRHKRRLKVEQEHSDPTRKKKLRSRQHRLLSETQSSPSLKSTLEHQLLQEIHFKAWGKLWPTKTCVIRRCEIFPDETDTGDDEEHMEIDDARDDGAEDGNDVDFGKIPEETALECLCNADLLQRAFSIAGSSFKYIVVCEEYIFLRELLEAEIGDYILTGQPGTGKTIFLLDLLLYRLQHELPTAVQFSRHQYIVFTEGGVSICATEDSSTDHLKMLPEGCWCLTDGSSKVDFPCEPFHRNDLRTFLITSPWPDKFKKWRTEVSADTVITALPRAVEIVAIAKMNGWKASDAITILKKWGPCTRTVLSILAKPAREKYLERFAAKASIDIYDDPSHVVSLELCELPTGNGSTLLFIRPIRSNHDPDYTDSEFIIPTIHLSKIFDDKSQGISAEVSVLVNIYALQPTIADTHDGPLEGLRKVWTTIGAAVADLFNWHFVLVSDNEASAIIMQRSLEMGQVMFIWVVNVSGCRYGFVWVLPPRKMIDPTGIQSWVDCKELSMDPPV